jgi:2-oxo-3-hexenedioate decarboxylase
MPSIAMLAHHLEQAAFTATAVTRITDEHPGLQTVSIVLRKNGAVVATATGAGVLRHPAASVAMLANMLGERGRSIPAGVLILSGGATEAIAVVAGDHITAECDWLGKVSMQFT